MKTKWNLEDTIAAISTPSGQGAIGVLRLSGSESLKILEKIWKSSVLPSQFEPRRVYLGKIISYSSPHHNSGQNVILDQVLVFWMKAPSSYTGEDTIEIQAHGGKKGMELLLENLIAAGARLAEPGEFTARAFLNGRMDLTQAEAVADLIAAGGSHAALLATRHMEGELSKEIKKLRNDLKVMRAQMEARIDFPEDEDVQGLQADEILERTERVRRRIQEILSTYEEGRLFREGLRVAIVGKPNVGKSSLFNALLKQDRAIVHATPGTTRDLIEETLDLKGLAVRFIDTAGLREGKEAIESEGIRRTKNRLSQADLILIVLDASRPLDQEDESVFETVQKFQKEKTLFYLLNKKDLPSSLSAAFLRQKLGDVSVLEISAEQRTGLEDLKKAIHSKFIQEDSLNKPILTNLRHRTLLQKAQDALQIIQRNVQDKKSLELLVTDLTVAMNFLDEITGEITNDEILAEIFSKFCIGK